MRNGQITRAITEAQERLDKQGSENISITDAIFATTGYLKDAIAENRNHVVTMRFEGKKFLAIGMGLGGVLIGAVMSLIQQ